MDVTRRAADHTRGRGTRTSRRVVAGWLTALTVGAATLAAPPATGMEAGRGGVGGPTGAASLKLDDTLLDEALDSVVEEGGGVGAVAEVRSGRQAWRGAAGHARVDPDRRARPWSQFRAASVTKTPVAVLALQLVHSGRWTLDTTMGEVLPDLWPERSDVTLRQLLSHTSGMPDYLPPFIAGTQSTEEFVDMLSQRRTDAELVHAARTQPWLFEPGTGWSYSNTGYIVVGMMLRAETGRSVADLLRRQVLRPARMTQSRLATSPLIVRPWLREYAVIEGELVDLRSAHPTLLSSAGALLTTTRDLNRFHRALSAGRLLPKRWVKEMRTPVHSDPTTGIEYGLGSYRLPDPCRPGGYVHGHDGGSFGTATLSFGSVDARRQVTVAATGRSFDDPTRPVAALAELTGTALQATCPAAAPSAQRRTPPRIPTPSDPLELLGPRS